MNILKWRFPKSGHAKKRGISAPEFETFKKSPFESLAREISQNSIDAVYSDEEPVKIVFNEFKIKKTDIPGINDYEKQIQNCIRFWKNDEKCKNEYESLFNELQHEYINCLRISDFNTTGLRGINSTSSENNQFLALTKGTGVSKKKEGITGGSKGVGKYATFGLSKFSLLFYSTITIDGEKGSIGVAELVSAEIPDGTENPDWTQGIGYYCIDDCNNPSSEILNLDSNFKRSEPGTDIYIIGFKSSDSWKKDVINKLLDSFLVCIYYNKLEIIIDETIINKETLRSIVYSDLLKEKEVPNIVSQYRLISNEKNDVQKYDIDTDYGKIDLYVLPLSNEENIATHRCSMIRYPYMKIREIKNNCNIMASALCIIGNNTLGKKLLNIENPEHDDWQYERIEDKNDKQEIKNTMKEVEDEIKNYMRKSINSGEIEKLDPVGAGDYLPSVDEGNTDQVTNITENDEQCTISPIKINITTFKRPIQKNDCSYGLSPDIGREGDDGDEMLHPTSSNSGDGNDHIGGNDRSKIDTGDNIINSIKELEGIKYRIIILNKNQGKYRIVFNYIKNIEKCKICFYILDDVGNKEEIKIKTIYYQNKFKNYNDDTFFNIIKGKNVIDIETDLKEIFSCEVKIYADF